MKPPFETSGAATTATVLETENLSFAYGANEVLKNITLQLRQHEISAFIGPSASR